MSIPRSGVWNIREISKQGLCYFCGAYPIELLLVGGGGSGGDWAGNNNGGGGSGGIIYSSAITVQRGCCYPVVVGAGTAPGHITGAPGANTCFCLSPTVTLVALRGMGGMSSPHVGQGTSGHTIANDSSHGPAPGQPCGYCFSFGSGGGAGDFECCCCSGGFGCQPQPNWWCGISNTQGYGNPGGQYSRFLCTPNPACNISCGGGGGGGAGQAGFQPSPNPTFPSGPRTIAGRGGVGLNFSISGSTIGYGGGGSARFDESNASVCCFGNELARPFGAGCHHYREEFKGWGWANQTYACPGIANRGGGGVASNQWGGSPGIDSASGSGVAIVRYNGLQIGEGGNSVTICTSPVIRTIHTYTGTGCFIG